MVWPLSDFVDWSPAALPKGRSYYDYDIRVDLWRAAYPDLWVAEYRSVATDAASAQAFVMVLLDLCGLDRRDRAGGAGSPCRLPFARRALRICGWTGFARDAPAGARTFRNGYTPR